MQLCFLILVLLAINFSPVQNSSDNNKAIETAKHTSVRQIDNLLPDKSFEQWLRELVGANTRIVWEVNDCGEQSGNPEIDRGRNFPMCVSALVDLAINEKLDVQLVVGTFKSGVDTGPASFHHAAVFTPSGKIEFVKSLSQLSETINNFR